MMSDIKGMVFAIEEFSTFDGPGIRTTVFLKGCPLRCSWCHNPEGQSFSREILRSPNGCIGCGKCRQKAMELTGKETLVPECIAVCPRNLIREAGTEYTTPAKRFCWQKPLDCIQRLIFPLSFTKQAFTNSA